MVYLGARSAVVIRLKHRCGCQQLSSVLQATAAALRDRCSHRRDRYYSDYSIRPIQARPPSSRRAAAGEAAASRIIPPSFLLSYSHTFKRNHKRTSYYLRFSANPLREHVKFLSRHTRWVAGSCALSAYRFPQASSKQGTIRHRRDTP